MSESGTPGRVQPGPFEIVSSYGNVPPLVEVAFVIDRRGDVWRIVRDGGMAARIDRFGGLESAGVHWLRDNLGPLVAFDPVTYRAGATTPASTSGSGS